MRGLTALNAVNGLLLLLSGLFAFVVVGSAWPVWGQLNPVGATYASVALLIPFVSAVSLGLSLWCARRGEVRRAQWVAVLPLAALASCAVALVVLHLSLTSRPL
jgi:hypothetical protein